MFSLFKSKPDSSNKTMDDLKLNLGCGYNKLSGYLNVDKFAECSPDLVVDLETFPWPFENDSVSEIYLNHVLEHLGATVETFKGIIQELYRVCRHDAIIQINVPHPRHDNFLDDPTHVRAITPNLMTLFDRSKCDEWEKLDVANSQLAKYWHVDMRITEVVFMPVPKYLEAYRSGAITDREIAELAETQNNIISEYSIKLKVVK